MAHSKASARTGNKSSASNQANAAGKASAAHWLAAEPARSGHSGAILPAVMPASVVAFPDAQLAPAAAFAASASASVKAQASVSASGKGGGSIAGSISVSASISIGASLSAGKNAGGGKHTGKATGRDGDPDVAYAFDIQIGGVHYGTFTEVGGLSWKAEIQPMPEGGNNAFVRGLIKPGKFEVLTLKRGWFAATGEFIDLLRGVLQPNGKVVRKNVTITVLNRDYTEIGHYDLANAAIVEYEGPALNSMSGQVGFEQIRMVYDHFTYAPKG